MEKIKVVAKKDFIESIATSARPLPALSELIWNGLDAGSNSIKISINTNNVDGIDSIVVEDFGSGIKRSEVHELFGNLGDSWKRKTGKLNGRALHGKNGRGRLKAFSLGSHIEWNTVYESQGDLHEYSIVGRINSLEDFQITEKQKKASDTTNRTGTKVTVSNPLKNFKSLLNDSVHIELSKVFAAYLTEYPQVEIFYNGSKVDPSAVQDQLFEYDLQVVMIPDEPPIDIKLAIIEWKIETDRTVHLCDKNGISLHDTSLGQKIRAPGFNFTSYLKSDHFRELDKDGSLTLAGLHPDVRKIIDAASTAIKTHFRKRIAHQKSAIVDGWKKDNIYPYADDHDIGPVEEAERQVFDIIAVNVQTYLPSFEKSDITSKKFTFRLLSQAIKQNPEAVRTILNEVLSLHADTQNELANLLRKTSLSSIISSAKTVANRLNFLNALEQLVFDKESKQKLLERDQLHKILESESWIFHEEFSLSSSEERLEDVLKKHLSILGPRHDTDGIVDVGNGKTGRIDLMLKRTIRPRTGEYDYLVVELKRPRQKIDSHVLTQIEKYAIAVANDERFQGVTARWTFIAVSNELDDYAQRKAKQKDKPLGLVYEDGELNIKVWAKSWSDIIDDARSKLSFINNSLEYDADKDSAKVYLHETHAKYIPQASIFSKDSEGSQSD